jgi:hypothetical protein
MTKIVNAETGEKITRPMNTEETAIQDGYVADLLARQKIFTDEADTAATAKAALLARLGITADEATLLLS